MTPRAALLAVDAGGSKVDACLLRRDGALLGAARIQSSDHEGPGSPEHLELVAESVEAACREATIHADGRPIAGLGLFCLAGADFPTDDRRIGAWLRRRGFTEEDVLLNDSFAILRAGTERTWGVAVVCGHGTNCAGIAPNGRIYRIPAVGDISGDWGGGGDVGMAGLAAAARAEDGRGPATALRRLVPEHFGLRRPRQVVEAVYVGRVSHEQIDEIAPIVFLAAGEGDAVARSIVDRQGDEIVTMATAAIRKLRLAALDVEVVLGGGIFRNRDRAFFDRIAEGVQAAAPRATLRVVTAPPVAGAAMLGLDRLGAGRAAHRRALAALTHGRLRPTRRGR